MHSSILVLQSTTNPKDNPMDRDYEAIPCNWKTCRGPEPTSRCWSALNYSTCTGTQSKSGLITGKWQNGESTRADNAVDAMLCSTGAKGVLCGGCLDGYSFDARPDVMQCRSCDDSNSVNFGLAVLAVVTVSERIILWH